MWQAVFTAVLIVAALAMATALAIIAARLYRRQR